jgi:non-ribosomal peptide synthetase component F
MLQVMVEGWLPVYKVMAKVAESGKVVGLHMRHREGLVSVLFGIVEAGGTFLPLDSQYGIDAVVFQLWGQHDVWWMNFGLHCQSGFVCMGVVEAVIRDCQCALKRWRMFCTLQV